MSGYLTLSSAPDKAVCRALFVPDSEECLAIVRGALQELTFAESWAKFGALTQEQSAAVFVDMFDRFCFNVGVCRMIGEIVAYAGDTSPTDKWLVCDGSEVAQADYPDLYNVVGSTYGSASSGNFRLPDLRGRSLAGVGTGSGLTAVTLGEKYGEEAHSLSESELASHAHTVGGALTILAVSPGEVPVLAPDPLPGITGYTGSGTAHNTIGPRIGVSYLIVAKD